MPSASHDRTITFRPAAPNDCAHLALLSDMATRRMISFLWGLAADAGQSAFELGRDIILNDETHFLHHSNWRVAECGGLLAGAVSGYLLPPAADAPAPAVDLVAGLSELKAIAEGTWYIAAIALYPEFQGQGLGAALVADAEAMARAAGQSRVTLLVNSVNPRAEALYRKLGFAEWDRRPLPAFPGSEGASELILMVKDLG